MVLLQLKDPLELFIKRREFIPSCGFVSCHDMNLSNIKSNSFLLPLYFRYILDILDCHVYNNDCYLYRNLAVLK